MGVDGGFIEVVSPVTGVVLSIERGAGARVDAREPLVTVEADGMPMVVRAGVGGILREVQAEIGAEVEPGDVLALVEPRDSEAPATTPQRVDRHCTHCGSTQLEPGFIIDRDQGSTSQWIRGRLERGLLGGARLMGRHRVDLKASRCRRCSHLELFALDITSDD